MPINQIEQITLRVTTCEEDEEQSKTVEEDEFKQEDNAKEPVEGLHYIDYGDVCNRPRRSHQLLMIIVLRLVMLNDGVSSYGEDKPLAVAFKAVVHKEVEHCVGVDGEKACVQQHIVINFSEINRGWEACSPLPSLFFYK